MEIAVVKLDDIIGNNSRVQLLKIDAHGYEPFILNGAERMLMSDNVIMVTLEFWPNGIRRGQNDPVKPLETLWRQGWTCADWSANEHISKQRPSEVSDFVLEFSKRYSGKRCHDDDCWNFGLWEELLCIKRKT